MKIIRLALDDYSWLVLEDIANRRGLRPSDVVKIFVTHGIETMKDRGAI